MFSPFRISQLSRSLTNLELITTNLYPNKGTAKSLLMYSCKQSWLASLQNVPSRSSAEKEICISLFKGAINNMKGWMKINTSN